MPSILIIDDSAFMRTRIREAVQKDGYSVMEASDGLTGLHMALTRRPDCIILDLIMPEMDGFRMLRTLHEQGNRIPVLIVTADIQVSVQKQCLALGASALLTKPPQEKELRAAVREALSTQRIGTAVRQATPRQTDALREFISIGVGRAAASLNDMVRLRVILEVPFIKILSPLQFKQEMADMGDRTMAAVTMGFYGPFSGSAALVISPSSAGKLMHVLAAPAGRTTSPAMDQQETLREVGNIVVNGVLGSLGNILRQQISYSHPTYSEITVKNLFFSEKIGNETVFLFVRTRFAVEEIEVEGSIILLFTVGAFESILDAIDEMQ